VTEQLSFSHLVLIGAFFDAVAALAVLAVCALTGPRRITTTSVGLALLVAAAGAAVQTVMVEDGFGRLHVAYLYVFVTLPVVGVFLLVPVALKRFEVSRAVTVVAVCCAVLAGVGFYATHIEPFWLRTDRASLDADVLAGGDEIRIGVLSDLQATGVGDHERAVVRRLMAESPDLILISGDLFQSDGLDFDAGAPAMRDLLGELEAPGGVFVVKGDVDSPERIRDLIRGTDVQWLDNEVVTTDVRGLPVQIAGVPVEYASPSARAVIGQLDDTDDGSGLRLVLAHRPDVIDVIPEGGADLVVAGHTHGGQVQLPFFGPPVTLTGVPRDVAAGGLHEVNGQAIYVSAGAGMERHNAPQVRFLTRPSVGMVTVS